MDSNITGNIPPGSSGTYAGITPLHASTQERTARTARPVTNGNFTNVFTSSVPSSHPPGPPSNFSSELSPTHPAAFPTHSPASRAFQQNRDRATDPRGATRVVLELSVYPPQFGSSVHTQGRTAITGPTFNYHSAQPVNFPTISPLQVRTILFTQYTTYLPLNPRTTLHQAHLTQTPQ